jgi:methylated-DNA-[protein]-cysteine S-methyltransferase
MSNNMLLRIDRVTSPIGTLLLVCDEFDRVRSLDFEDHEARMMRLLRLRWGEHGYTLQSAAAPSAIKRHLAAYFAGDLAAINGVPVATGGTAFQCLVWSKLRRIPAGTAITYSALARAIGRADACRAVGFANSLNPVSIIVPCHRIIGANGSLVGYGGGLARKGWLIEHERAFAAASNSQRQCAASAT